jgi:hypothetical protein
MKRAHPSSLLNSTRALRHLELRQFTALEWRAIVDVD